MKMYTLYIIIRPASLSVVAGAASTIEDWSVSEGTKVREAVTQTTHTEGILLIIIQQQLIIIITQLSARAVLINVYYLCMYVLITRHS